MTAPLVYLAGPITGLDYEGATDWRDLARRHLGDYGITGLSPMRGKSYLLGETSLADEYADRNPMSTAKGILTRDRWDATRADVLLVNLLGAERVSIGTMVELGWADLARIPVVVVMEPGNIHDHSFVRGIAGYVVASLDDALRLITTMLAKGNGGS
jgi:nucleoside 2-deoxyribosyltransferase